MFTNNDTSSRPPFDIDGGYKWTQPPNPSWKPGDGLSFETAADAKKWKEDEAQGMMTWDPATASDPSATYRLLISGVTPRPIAFVSSVSAEGKYNLGPFSYFNLIGHNPPLLSVSFTHPPTKEKDSCRNIKEMKMFTVNIMSEPYVEAANWASVDAPHDVDEWVGTGLTQEPSVHGKAPRVKEAAFSMECELFQHHDFHAPQNPERVTSTLVIGYIKLIHVRKSVILDDPNTKHSPTVDPVKLKAVARLGGASYARISGGYDIKRPVWKDISIEEPVKGLYGLERGQDGPKAA